MKIFENVKRKIRRLMNTERNDGKSPEQIQAENTLIKRLTEALEKSKETIKDLHEKLTKIMTSPLAYGVIIKTGNKLTVPRPMRISDFAPKTKVKVRAEALAKYGLKHGFAKVRDVHEENMTASVKLVENNRTMEVDLDDLELQDKSVLNEIVDTVTLATSGGLMEVLNPSDFKLTEGDSVNVNPMTMGIVGVAPTKQYGSTATVKEVFADRGVCEIAEGDKSRVVYCGPGVNDLEKGDIVVLDSTEKMILINKKSQSKEYTLDEKMNVEWDQIGGLHETKKMVREMVELPHTHAHIFEYYNKKPAKGILLAGPPGCGRRIISCN